MTTVATSSDSSGIALCAYSAGRYALQSRLLSSSIFNAPSRAENQFAPPPASNSARWSLSALAICDTFTSSSSRNCAAAFGSWAIATPQLVGLPIGERRRGHPDFEPQQVQQHEASRQDRHVGTAALPRRETDALVAQVLQHAPGRIGQPEREHPSLPGLPACLDRLDAGSGRRLEDESGRLGPPAPIIRELLGLVALGGPPGPLPEQERPELGGVEGGAAPGEDQTPDAPLDEAPGERRQLGAHVDHLPHQLRLAADVLNQEIRVPLPNLGGTPDSSPEGHAGELFFQPDRQRIIEGRRRRPGIRVHQVASPPRQSVLRQSLHCVCRPRPRAPEGLCRVLVVCPLNKLTLDLRGVSTVRAGIAVRRPVRPRASNRNIISGTYH